MTREEAIAQLEDLRAHCEIFVHEDSVWSDDVEALNIAIEVLKRERGAESGGIYDIRRKWIRGCRGLYYRG